VHRWAIRRKLDDTITDLFGDLWKPKWMRWRTFQCYTARDAALVHMQSSAPCCAGWSVGSGAN
jgi:hypothetical protein